MGSTRHIVLQQVQSNESLELEVDIRATAAQIKNILITKFGADPEIKLLARSQQATTYTTLENGEPPPKTGRIFCNADVQFRFINKEVAPLSGKEVANPQVASLHTMNLLGGFTTRNAIPETDTTGDSPEKPPQFERGSRISPSMTPNSQITLSKVDDRSQRAVQWCPLQKKSDNRWVHLTLPTNSRIRDAKRCICQEYDLPASIRIFRIQGNKGPLKTALDSQRIPKNGQLIVQGLTMEKADWVAQHALSSIKNFMSNAEFEAKDGDQASAQHKQQSRAACLVHSAEEKQRGFQTPTRRNSVDDVLVWWSPLQSYRRQDAWVPMIISASANVSDVKKQLCQDCALPQTIRLLKQSFECPLILAPESEAIPAKKKLVVLGLSDSEAEEVLKNNTASSTFFRQESPEGAAGSQGKNLKADRRRNIMYAALPFELVNEANQQFMWVKGLLPAEASPAEIKKAVLFWSKLDFLPSWRHGAPEVQIGLWKGDTFITVPDNEPLPTHEMSGEEFQVYFVGMGQQDASAWGTFFSFAHKQSFSGKCTQEERDITIILQYADEKVDMRIMAGSTLADLKRNLVRNYGIPGNAELRNCNKNGLMVKQIQNDHPRRVVMLPGVVTLQTPTKVVEQDMLSIVREMNKQFGTSKFQQMVLSWKGGTITSEKHRQEVKEIEDKMRSKFGFQMNEEGQKEWEKMCEAFQRFPAFAELWRQTQILVGNAAPELPTGSRLEGTCDGEMMIREITAGAALVAQKKEAEAVFDLLYQRIYEENRHELWRGGNVRGHKIPTRQAVARKYLEPPGTSLLHCSSLKENSRTLVGGAVIFQVNVDIPNLMRHDMCGESTEFLGIDSKEEEEDDDEAYANFLKGSLDCLHVSAGYIDAVAASPKSHAGTAMIRHIAKISEDKNWDMLVLHSIRIEATYKFWESRGFHHYSAGKDAAFRMECVQHIGQSVPLAAIEGQLPERPGCLLYVKFMKPY